MTAQPFDPLSLVQQLEDPDAIELVRRIVESEMTLLESRLVQLGELRRNLNGAGRSEDLPAAAAGASR